jgi:hypothetical protein
MTNELNNKEIIHGIDYYRVYVVAEVYLEWMLDQQHPIVIPRIIAVN